MADRYKLLGQVNQVGSGGGTQETLYQVPSAAAVSVGSVEVAPKSTSQIVQTLVTSIYIANRDNVKSYVALSLKLDGGSDHYLFLFNDLEVSETKVLSVGLTLSSGDALLVQSHGFFGSAFDTDWTCFGIETTMGPGPSV